jgi:hypothetical protein
MRISVIRVFFTIFHFCSNWLVCHWHGHQKPEILKLKDCSKFNRLSLNRKESSIFQKMISSAPFYWGNLIVKFSTTKNFKFHFEQFCYFICAEYTLELLITFITHLESWKKMTIWGFKFFILFSYFSFLFKLILVVHWHWNMKTGI